MALYFHSADVKVITRTCKTLHALGPFPCYFPTLTIPCAPLTCIPSLSVITASMIFLENASHVSLIVEFAWSFRGQLPFVIEVSGQMLLHQRDSHP